MQRLLKKFVMAALFIHASSTSAFATGPSKVVVSHAWIRLPPPGGHMAALYLDATNSSNTDEAIDRVVVSGVESAHVHETFVDAKGMTRMRSATNVVIPANKSLSLSPGGLHVMLHGLTGLKLGQTVQGSLRLKSGNLIKFTAETKGAAD